MFSFYYNTIQSPEQVFLLFIYKILLIIYEHLCSNLQFISLPEKVGEFLLYIMLNVSKQTIQGEIFYLKSNAPLILSILSFQYSSAESNGFSIIKLQKLLVIYNSMCYLVFIQINFNKINFNKKSLTIENISLESQCFCPLHTLKFLSADIQNNQMDG